MHEKATLLFRFCSLWVPFYSVFAADEFPSIPFLRLMSSLLFRFAVYEFFSIPFLRLMSPHLFRFCGLWVRFYSVFFAVYEFSWKVLHLEVKNVLCYVFHFCYNRGLNNRCEVLTIELFVKDGVTQLKYEFILPLYWLFFEQV